MAVLTLNLLANKVALSVDIVQGHSFKSCARRTGQGYSATMNDVRSQLPFYVIAGIGRHSVNDCKHLPCRLPMAVIVGPVVSECALGCPAKRDVTTSSVAKCK